MAVLFSAVTVTANGDSEEFLVGGIPKVYDDLKYWTKFDSFIEKVNRETKIVVHTESYIYGEGEVVKAMPEEIAYFMKRINSDSDFLSTHCKNIGNSDFTIQRLRKNKMIWR